MGVSGVALATTLAEISGAVSLAVLLRRKKLLRGFRMPARRPRPVSSFLSYKETKIDHKDIKT